MFNKIIAATTNKGKLAEIQSILGAHRHVVGINSILPDFEVVEDGKTFEENARIKAAAAAALIDDAAVLADDSGLVVPALNGEPGIYSARYAGNGATDRQNYNRLLERLKGIKDRRAYFECCMVMALPGGKIISASGKTYGHILTAPEGGKGFGYDPVFFSNELNMSMAAADPAQKNLVSHRAKALNRLKALLDGEL